jgi:dolichol-phosphate mannosyltransferase
MFTLVLPTYNESHNIARCIAEICAVLEGREFEIIVSDDDSPDRTWEVAENLRNPHVRVLRRTDNRGLSPAVIEGFSIARGSFLGVMDADLQHDESILPRMLDLLDTYEMVIGSRAAQGGSYGEFTAWRHFSSVCAAVMARILLRIPVRDPMAGYFVIRREVYERALPRLSPKGFKIMLEIFCCACPVTFAEVGFYFRNRQAGSSKLSTGVIIQYLVSLIELRSKMRK